MSSRALEGASNSGAHSATIRDFYRALSVAWGAQHWWPAQTRFEVIVGAYLTQNTAWTNVERVLANLRSADALSVAAIRTISIAELEPLVRPAGYFRQKAQRLKQFVSFLDARYRGSLDALFARPTSELRQELLALNGIGPETADSILLYAGDHPAFVVDTYTRRLVARHGLSNSEARYEEIRAMFEQALRPEDFVAEAMRRIERPADFHSLEIVPPNSPGTRPMRGSAHEPGPVSTAPRAPLAQIYSEMHALIVGVGKLHCFKGEPHCSGCPLQPFLPPNAVPK